jgi:hypothetical protein
MGDHIECADSRLAPEHAPVPATAASEADLQTYAIASRMIQRCVSLAAFHPTQHPRRRVLFVLLDGENASIPGRESPLRRFEQDLLGHRRAGLDRIDAILRDRVDDWSATAPARAVVPRAHPLERLYADIRVRAQAWGEGTDISVVILGSGRGAVEAATLADLIHRRGLSDPVGSSSAAVTIPIALGLFDPLDRTADRPPVPLPPNIRGGLQLTASRVGRATGTPCRIICTQNNHDDFDSMYFRNLTLAGDHHDLCGGHPAESGERGLSQRAGDLMAQYLNTLCGSSLFPPTPPERRERDVVHGVEPAPPAPMEASTSGTAATGQSPNVRGDERRTRAGAAAPRQKGHRHRGLERLLGRLRRLGRTKAAPATDDRAADDGDTAGST